MKKGDQFVLTLPYSTYYDSNQYFEEDEVFSEEDYNTYFFNKLVTITNTSMNLTVDEDWCEIQKKVDDTTYTAYLPSFYFNFNVITDEKEIQEIINNDEKHFASVKETESQMLQEKNKRIGALPDKRDNFYEAALLAAITGAASTYNANDYKAHHFVDEMVSLAMEKFDKYHNID